MNTETRLGTVPEWTIPDRLRKARELTGLDQSEFANALGVSRGTVSNYERGSRVYRRPVLLAWAMCAGVPMEWLQGEQESPRPASPIRFGIPPGNTDRRYLDLVSVPTAA